MGEQTLTRIDHFDGAYAFLSNFAASTVTLDGDGYPTVEHAFQAAKTHDAARRRTIRDAKTPALAKGLGRRIPLRDDWEDVKIEIMTYLVREKFTRHPDLRQKLLNTGNAELIEGNSWGDTFWGVCDGDGRNELGKILMDIRAELRGLDDQS